MQNHILMINPMLNEIVPMLTGKCGKCSFDVLYIDMDEPEHSMDMIVKNGYDLLVFQCLSSTEEGLEKMVDMVNYGYLSGKKILLVSDTMDIVSRVERKLDSTIMTLRNIKYVLTPIDEDNFVRRLDQLLSSKELKTTQDIFDELQTEIVRRRNVKKSRLSRFVERII